MSEHKGSNIILVTVDCLRADVLSLFGYDRPTTPNIDRIADEGQVYKQCFANGVMTGSSFPSLIVSRYRHSYDGPALPADVPTLAMSFADAGYRTAGVVAANPNLTPTFGYDAGFDVFTDFITKNESALTTQDSGAMNGENGVCARDSNPSLTDRIVNFVQDKNSLKQVVKPVYIGLRYQLLNPYRKVRNYARFLTGGAPNALTEHVCQSADEIVDYGINWIEGNDRPFFLWLHFMDPHSWYAPADEHVKELGYESRSRLTQLRANRALISASPFKGDPDVDAVNKYLETLRVLYDGAVRQVDTAIGALDAALDRYGLSDETVLTITSDHGEEFLEYGSVQHGGMPNTALTHVPLIMRGPGVQANRSQSVVELIDVPPTLLSLAGVSIPDAYQGRDLTHVPDEDHVAISARYDSTWTVAARDNRYTLLFDDGEQRLYDRAADYYEKSPLESEEDAWDQGVYETLAKSVDSYINSCTDTTVIPNSDELSATVNDRLENLGYK